MALPIGENIVERAVNVDIRVYDIIPAKECESVWERNPTVRRVMSRLRIAAVEEGLDPHTLPPWARDACLVLDGMLSHHLSNPRMFHQLARWLPVIVDALLVNADGFHGMDRRRPRVFGVG